MRVDRIGDRACPATQRGRAQTRASNLASCMRYHRPPTAALRDCHSTPAGVERSGREFLPYTPLGRRLTMDHPAPQRGFLSGFRQRVPHLRRLLHAAELSALHHRGLHRTESHARGPCSTTSACPVHPLHTCCEAVSDRIRPLRRTSSRFDRSRSADKAPRTEPGNARSPTRIGSPRQNVFALSVALQPQSVLHAQSSDYIV